MSVSTGIKDRTFYFKFNPGGSDSYITDTWVFWDGDLTDIAEAEKYESVCKSAWLLIATWDTAHENYSESKDISWTGSENNYVAKGDFYNRYSIYTNNYRPTGGIPFKKCKGW